MKGLPVIQCMKKISSVQVQTNQLNELADALSLTGNVILADKISGIANEISIALKEAYILADNSLLYTRADEATNGQYD